MNAKTDMHKLRISIIGAGNVATHIATALSSKAKVIQIYTPHMESASRLAGMTGAEAIDDLSMLDTTVDGMIISIKDDAVEQLLGDISRLFTAGQTAKPVWMHTAGSVDMNCFPDSMPRHGILYPLQTFSRDVAVDMRLVPFFIEASDSKSLEMIYSVASLLSDTVKPLDSESRRTLHAAAVLACNMPMYLWSLAHDILQTHGLDFTVMRPLLEVTLDKAMNRNPADVITGPARRGDKVTIAKHLSDLPPKAAEIYAVLSNEILKMFNHPTITDTQ